MHWGSYTICAVAGSIAVALLLISDLVHVESIARWGLLAGLLAAVMAAAIIANRCARQLEVAADERARVALNEVEAMMERHADRVVKAYEEQTEAIAHAVCDSVLNAIDSRMGPAATPINSKR